jgi:hypothetical protein
MKTLKVVNLSIGPLSVFTAVTPWGSVSPGMGGPQIG